MIHSRLSINRQKERKNCVETRLVVVYAILTKKQDNIIMNDSEDIYMGKVMIIKTSIIIIRSIFITIISLIDI